MDVEKKRFRRMFPNLSQELDSGNCGTKKADTRRFTDYTPDVIDYLRRCDKAEQAEEIIGYLEKRREISFEYAKKLRKQLKEKGVRSFGSKKEDDYYLKQDEF